MAKGYNGHPSWAYWNVALWFGNDEGLYRMALDYIRQCKTRKEAAEALVAALADAGFTHTPDGARYSVSAVRHALTGL